MPGLGDVWATQPLDWGRPYFVMLVLVKSMKALIACRAPRMGMLGGVAWVMSLTLAVVVFPPQSLAAESNMTAGFGKQDITPTSPVRLSGYATRKVPFEKIRDRLFVRCMAMGSAEGDLTKVHLVVSIEGLAVSATQSKHLAQHVQDQYGIARAQIVICSTHSHAAPHSFGAIPNLFRQPLSDEEQASLKEYTAFVDQQSVKAIDQAMDRLQPASLFIGDGRADFAVNRRVLSDGLWTGFGITPNGPTDRRVRVMKAVDAEGKLMGGMFQYACHCTTLGPSFNEVTGDWAGLAAQELEAKHDSAILVPVIGCGADANPEPRDSYSAAVDHGHAMAIAVDSVLRKQQLLQIDQVPESRFGYAGLSAEQPSQDAVRQLLNDDNASNRNWAAMMLQIWEEKGRLPESYPAPIHTWVFGDALAWIFLGGEVVVDYQIRLERELERFDDVWVAAYTDDCFAYVASERMRAEGGYEVDFSMIYYGQPGRWESGTEDLLIRRVHEVMASDQPDQKPKSPEESLSMIDVQGGFEVSLVACEPIVQDPINIAFAADGSVWVVEMADYPLGVEGGGRVKRLSDTDGDGRLDQADVFLSELNYPTSVMPWRDGVLVIAAPDVIFARDTDHDGTADQREVLLTGIGEANPQHRASGFEWGLDGRVYFGAGDDTDELLSHRNGQRVHVRGGDVRWDPDSGDIAKVTGKTQFLRSRDRWGRWYGNSNSLPLFHYRMESTNFDSGSGGIEPSRLVLKPGVAPPVFPSSRVVDRFNDLFAKQRFTSACGSIVVCGAGMGDAMQDTAVICEPVHNLVARFALTDDGESVRGDRFADDVDAGLDWLVSTDTWFRPVRTIEAPDGSVWVVDMYRRVIEHPEWIPDAWQEQIDVRSGSEQGRIYRVAHPGAKVGSGPLVAKMNADELVESLIGPRAVVRDLAMQRLMWDKPEGIGPRLREMLSTQKASDARLRLFATLVALGDVTESDWQVALNDSDARVVAWAARAAANHEFESRFTLLMDVLGRTTETDPAMDQAKFQSLLTLGQLETPEVDPLSFSRAVRTVLKEGWQESWCLDGLALMRKSQASLALPSIADFLDQHDMEAIADSDWNRLEAAVRSIWDSCDPRSRRLVLADRLPRQEKAHEAWTTIDASTLMLMLAASGNPAGDAALDQLVRERVEAALRSVGDVHLPTAVRLRAAKLLGTPAIAAEDQVPSLKTMLAIDQPADIRAAALTSAYRVDCAETADVLISAWPHLIPNERRIAGQTLLQRWSWTRRLVDGLVNGPIRIADLDPATLSELQNCRDYRVMKTIGSLIRQPTERERASLVNQHIAYLKEHSRPTLDAIGRGRKLYQENCATCHESVIDPSGLQQAAIGPALANLKAWNDGQWVAAILDPNATVEPKYRQYRVLTDSGQVFAGRVLDQSDDVILLGMADGRRVPVNRGELESMQDSGVSLMPEGFEAKLTKDQMADLITFLRSL